MVEDIQQLQGRQNGRLDIGGAAGFSEEFRLLRKLPKGLHRVLEVWRDFAGVSGHHAGCPSVYREIHGKRREGGTGASRSCLFVIRAGSGGDTPRKRFHPAQERAFRSRLDLCSGRHREI